MQVHLTFLLPAEIEKYSDAIHGSTYKKIIEKIEQAADPKFAAVIKSIKLNALAGEADEKIKGKGLEQDG